MPSKTPMREPLLRGTPRVVSTFSDKVNEYFKQQHEKSKEGRTRSGLISGGKMGQPTLWSVLDILGLEKEFDAYTLGKFQRGHDVETRAIVLLTNLPYEMIYGIVSGERENPGWIDVPDGAVLRGQVHLQYESNPYRGAIGYVDLSQRLSEEGELIHHEVKSVTKMAYDKVSASGRSKGDPEPYPWQAMQVAMYALGDGVSRAFIHYFNADDYRLTSFSINPLDYKEEIDKEIDDIQAAFLTKTLPSFEAIFPHHKIKNYQKYGDEWNKLTPAEMLAQLKTAHPEAYQLFMSKELPNEETK